MSEAMAFSRPEPFEVPEGGLASFLTADVGDWADEDTLPSGGISSVKHVADELAKFGRYEDTYVVHAAEGETVVPMAVFDENPRLKQALFKQMRSMGIDPERYVVGNELNSINPVTGQPEFFLKKLFKGLKNAVKSVVKVVKKAAPLILSVGLNMLAPGLGTIAAGAIGSGIGTLIQGGNLKDALKSAAIGGAIGGLFSGVQGGIQATKAGQSFTSGFGEGVRGALPGAQQAAQQAASQAVEQVAEQNATTVAKLAETQSEKILAVAQGARPAPTGLPTVTSTAPRPSIQLAGPSADAAASGVASGAVSDAASGAASGAPPTVLEELAQRLSNATGQQTAQTGALKPQPRFYKSVKAAFNPNDDVGFFEGMKDAFLPKRYTAADVLESQGIKMVDATPDMIRDAGVKASAMNSAYLGEGLKGTIRSYGPLVAAGTGIMAATGAFKAPEMETVEPFGGVTGMDLLKQNPELYRAGAPQYSGRAPTPVTESAPIIPYTRLPQVNVPQPYQPRLVYPPVIGAARGGSMDFPRRNGAIAGPGTETSDDIPAMLSDGEFVFTARAVRGAGNGNRKQGVRKMYQIMRNFEGMA